MANLIAAENTGIPSTDGWEFAWWALVICALLAWAVIRRWRPLPPDPNKSDDEAEDE